MMCLQRLRLGQEQELRGIGPITSDFGVAAAGHLGFHFSDSGARVKLTGPFILLHDSQIEAADFSDAQEVAG